MSRPKTLPAVLVLLAGIAAACSSSPSAPSSGGSSTSSTSSTTTTTAASAHAISLVCPSGATVGSTLGRTLPAPTSLPASNLPAGESGIACEYAGGTGSAVILDLNTGIMHPASALSATESAQEAAAAARGGHVTFTNVSGVGSGAVIFDFQITGQTENGIFAGQGVNGVALVATPAATTGQLEALANLLL